MNLASLDLNLLVALDVLLEEQSVTRAAERLFVGQPTMSGTLAKLRTVFNDPLLVRDGRGLRRTPVADSLREPLASVLSSIQHLVDSTKAFDPTSSDRVFTITASDYVGLVLLRPLIERLTQERSKVQLNVRPVHAGLLDDLIRGTSDLVIYPLGLLPRNHPFATVELFNDEFVCVVDAAHPEVGDQITPEQFAELPYLAINQGVMRSIAEEHLDDLGHQRNTVMTAQSFVVAPFLLPGTRMFTLVQRRYAHIVVDNERFRILPPPHPVPPIQEALVWAPRTTQDPALSWLRAQLVDLAQGLPSGHPLG